MIRDIVIEVIFKNRNAKVIDSFTHGSITVELVEYRMLGYYVMARSLELKTCLSEWFLTEWGAKRYFNKLKERHT